MEVGDSIWYFDSNAKGWEAKVEKIWGIEKNPTINLSYKDKTNKDVHLTSIIHKENATVVEFHPFKKYPEGHEKAGKPLEWNVKINCYKERNTQ